MIGVFGIMAGHSSGHAYLEMPGYALPFLFAAYGLIGGIALVTFHKRQVRELWEDNDADDEEWGRPYQNLFAKRYMADATPASAYFLDVEMQQICKDSTLQSCTLQ